MNSMNPILLDSLKRIEDQFRTDERCVGIFLSGSLGKGTADAYSDVDVVVIIRDEDYAAVTQELRDLCATRCGKILVWLPEGESADACNYAFLFEGEADLLLYDLTLLTATAFSTRRMHPDRILFDRTGLLQTASRENAPSSTPFPADTIRWLIDNYWVYMYLNGKYSQRADIYKLLYVQGVLFQTHVSLLNALHPETQWTWWARDIKHLPEAQREQLLVYFGAVSREEIAAALRQEMDLFSADAQAVCRTAAIAYPQDLEAGVRKHLEITGASG